RRANGMIDCDVIVKLPPPGPFEQSVPTECTGPLLSPVTAPRTTRNPAGGVNCKITQRAVRDGMPESGGGFYYDDTISEDDTALCMQNRDTVIRLTEDARSWIGLRSYVDCAAGVDISTPP